MSLRIPGMESYRRPAGWLNIAIIRIPWLAISSGSYEGLTEYTTEVFFDGTVRGCGRPNNVHRDALAETGAMLDHPCAGRTWRPLEDTARSVQILRLQGPQWQSWRRSALTIIPREVVWLAGGGYDHPATESGAEVAQRFLPSVLWKASGPRKVVPYTFDDVVRGLSQVVPYDWASLLEERVNATSTHAPLGGIEHGGWRLVYDDRPNVFHHHRGRNRRIRMDASYSLGFVVRKDGELSDVLYGSPAYVAGIESGDEAGGDQWACMVEGCSARYAARVQRHEAADRVAGTECKVLQDLFHRLPRRNQESRIWSEAMGRMCWEGFCSR